MKLKYLFRRITVFISFMWLASCAVYVSFVLGTLAHELVHYENAIKPVMIQVNYDTSGLATAEGFEPHDHDVVYRKGFFVELVICLFSIFCLYNLLWYDNREG